MERPRHLLPFAAVIVGIALFSLMDAAMKAASIAAGVYSALLLRNMLGAALMLPAWLASGRKPFRPGALKVHVQRAAVVACMAPLFFYGLVRIPMAEGIAISFIAPLIALYLATLMLGEILRPSAIVASLLGIAGVLVIAAGRFGEGRFEEDAVWGIAAILISAVFYAVNLVLQRRQATLAGPFEIAFFQNLFAGLFLLVAAPWLFAWPETGALRDIALGAVLATAALLFLSWGYARAEAQALVPIEYTGFVWAALFGWLWFGETVGIATIGGAVLIVAGCLLVARKHTEQTAL
jgi:S-adenosylmethionine uptake transporter